MAASPSQKQINAALARLKRKNPGVEYVVLRASNGEVAIMPKQETAVQAIKNDSYLLME